MHRNSSRVLLIVAAFALFLVPVAAIAAGGFTDVADDNVFKADIQWMRDAGVTKGCNPPTNDKFCPEGNVTREQMSAFMHRLAVNRVVDAGTVEGKTAEQLKGQKGDTGPAGPAGPAGETDPAVVAAIAALESAVASLKGDVTVLQSENDALKVPLEGVTRNGDTLLFSGMNLQVVNGQGSTDTTNGLGNVIVGYNTDTLSDGFTDQRTGSHSLVVGDEHTYSSYATLIVGYDNSATNVYSGTIGYRNKVGGFGSFASGSRNTLLSSDSFISGHLNSITAPFVESFIAGGRENTITNSRVFIGGGWQNTGGGSQSFIGGGEGNETTDTDTFASGYYNTANGYRSFIAGGQFNITDGSVSFVTGDSNTTSTGYGFDYGASMETRAGSLAVDVTGDGSFDSIVFPRASVTRTGTGTYNVAFDRDLLGCVPVVATASANHTIGVVRGISGSADVTIIDRSTGVATDGAFFLAATC